MKHATPYRHLNTMSETGISGLKPPDKLNSAEEFKRWRQRYEIYCKASGAVNKSSEMQVALLLHCMGDQCIDIYNTFNLSEEDAQNYDIVMKKFTDYFIPIKNESVTSHIFFTRNQNPGESYDTFFTELKKLSQECNFGNLQDRMLKDRIVAGILDVRLKDRLLRESDLTLVKTIQICKAAEIAGEQVKQINDMNVHASCSKEKTYQKKTYSKTAYNPKTNKKQVHVENYKKREECDRCALQHEKNKCPAYGKKCLKCGKIGHYARKCRGNMVKSIQYEETRQCIDSDSSGEFNMCNINVHNVNVDRNWFQNVQFIDQDMSIKFKLDTGAQCNVIPHYLCKDMNNIIMKPCKMKLRNYNGHEIPTVGQINALCQIGKGKQVVNFQVSQGNFIPILGLPTLIKFNLIERNINSVQAEKYMLISRYKDVFEGIGEIKDYEYKIKLKEGWKGKIEASRHVPFKLMPRLKSELNNLESLGIISKIDTPTDFVSSLVMTTKPNGQLRVCLDPQYLNSQIQREQMLIPTLDEITSKLNGSCVFSTLDANKGFWMIKLSLDSRELTTFNTPYGRYHFNRLPFGLSSSPEVFQKIFSNIFKDIEGVEIYIDDILIHARNEIEHDRLLVKVLERAKQYGVKFNKSKCVFKQKQVKYLGHILTTEGLNVDHDRVKAIIEMKEPKDQKELLRFLGMINYISKFIPNVSEITAALRELIKKDVPFVWSERQQQAYNKIKKLISEPPVLAYFSVNENIVLSVDASKDGLGAVIMQEGRPVAYGSRAMTEAEKLYSQIEKESLAILYGCTKFHQYLYGQNFMIETDHKPLVSIFSKPLNKCPARLQKIRMALQPYSFNLTYKPGKELLVADHLSRSYLNDTSKTYDLEIETHVGMIMNSFKITDQKMKEIKEETIKDKELMCVCKYIREGWPENKNLIDCEAKIYYSYRDELSECEGLIFKGTQIVIPKEKRKEVLEKIHYAHLGIEKCKMLARKSIFWPNMSKEIEDLIQNCDTCKSFQNNNRKEPMVNKEIAEGPWQILATDIFFLHSKPYILVVDSFSKFVEVKELDDLSAKSTINSIKEIFARNGVPEIVYSDTGSQFTSSEFKMFSQVWNFEHKMVSPKHHQANGLAERYIQTVKRILKKLIYENKDIQLGLLIYRNTPVGNENKTPAELLFNRNVKNILPFVKRKYYMNDSYKKELKQRQIKQKKYYDKTARYLPELKEGDVIKLQDETNRKPHESGIVLEKGQGPRSYKIKNENGNVIVRNRKMLIKGGIYRERNDLFNEPTYTPNITQENQNNLRNNISVNDPIQNENFSSVRENVTNGYTTRSGRSTKRPSHLKDYV